MSRIFTAPPECHDILEQKKRTEQKYNKNKKRNPDVTLKCGCVQLLEPDDKDWSGYRTLTVHFCPGHWAERIKR